MDSIVLTPMRTVAVDVGDANVEESRANTNGDDVESQGAESRLVEVDVHVLARIVATEGGHNRVGRLAAHHEPVVFAQSSSRAIQVELEEVEPNLAHVGLPGDAHRAGARVLEGRGGAWVAEVGAVVAYGVAASRLDCTRVNVGA